MGFKPRPLIDIQYYRVQYLELYAKPKRTAAEDLKLAALTALMKHVSPRTIIHEN